MKLLNYKYSFGLIAGIILLISAISEIVIFSITNGTHQAYFGLMYNAIIFFFITLIFFIYSLITKKVKFWYNYLVITVVLLVLLHGITNYWWNSIIFSSGPYDQRWLNAYYGLYFSGTAIRSGYIRELMQPTIKLYRVIVYTFQMFGSVIILPIFGGLTVADIIKNKKKRKIASATVGDSENLCDTDNNPDI